MPKDPTKNIFQYKIRGGHLNEFEFQQNQGDVTEQKDRPWEKQNFDPNAKTPEPTVKPERKSGKRTGGKEAKPATASTKKQPAKAMKKATKKAVKKSATTARKSAAKKSISPKAKPTRRAKKGSTSKRSAKK
ncbi:MAG TPA: hypothetical protein VJU84_12450 [Pyrinomonadaceae bacterium]|nr:hypothetical protein [Pyrinomonadaceae bacterium]